MDFRRTGTLAPPQPAALTQNPEASYWQQFGSPIFIKEFSPINAINFVPFTHASSSVSRDTTSIASRQVFAVTSATRVQIFSMRTGKVIKTMSRFKDVARSGSFRADGKLLVAGDDSGLVQVFDAQSRSVLRQFKGHDLAVHAARFSCEPTQIVTASDDRTVRMWDMPTEKEARMFAGHEDYVRSAVVSPDNGSLIVSGSYDGTVRLWDARTSERGGCAITMRHGAPVEDVLIFPTGGGGMALSAGGPVLRSWDLMMGGRCRNAISNHSKTITSLAISMTSGADSSAAAGLGGVRVLTAGLDQLVKVYDPERDYRVVHTMRYSAPILSLGISPDESQIVTGMADGTLCIRKRSLKAAESQHRRFAAQTGQALQYFLPAGDTTGTSATATGVADREAGNEIHIGIGSSKRKLKTHDKLLKSFRYGDALDEVLRKGVRTEVTFAVLNELRNRSTTSLNGTTSLDGLRRAIAGRDDVTLEPLLQFLLRHAGNARWAPIVSDCLDVVMDVYAPVLGQSPVIDEIFGKIWAKIADEIAVQRQLVEVRGALEMVLLRSALR